MKIIKNMLPIFPSTTYEAKKVICPLGLAVQKIHACPNECILCRGEEYEKLEACPVCEALHYKIKRDNPSDVEGQASKKKVFNVDFLYSTMVEPFVWKQGTCKVDALTQRRT